MNDLLLYHNNWFTCTFSMASSKKMKDANFFSRNLPKEPKQPQIHECAGISPRIGGSETEMHRRKWVMNKHTHLWVSHCSTCRYIFAHNRLSAISSQIERISYCRFIFERHQFYQSPMRCVCMCVPVFGTFAKIKHWKCTDSVVGG